MPQEDYKNETELQIANLEQGEQTPETLEVIAKLRASLEKEVNESVAEFKEEDKQVEEIEKSVNLSDPAATEKIKTELYINEKLEKLNEEAESLKEEILKNEELSLNLNSIENIKIILDAEQVIAREEERLSDLNKRNAELNPKEYQIRVKTAENEILKARGEISTHSEGISTEELNLYKKQHQVQRSDMSISAETKREQEANERATKLIEAINLIKDKILSYEIDEEALLNFQYSDDKDNRVIFDEISAYSEKLDLDKDLQFLLNHNPNILLDSLPQIHSTIFQKEILKNCAEKENISAQKIIDIIYSSQMSPSIVSEIETELGDKLSKDKQEALKKLPVEEFLDSWEKEAPTTKGWSNYSKFSEAISEKIDTLSIEGKFKDITKIKDRLDKINEVSNNSIPKFHESYPKWLSKLNLNSEDSLKLLTKTISPKTFHHYFENSNDFVPPHLIPEGFGTERKIKYYDRLFSKTDLSPSELLNYSKIVDRNVFEIIDNNPKALMAVISYQNLRKSFLPKILFEYKNKENFSVKTKILESFLVKDNRAELPPIILETLERFENNYGNKGTDLIALAISAYGIENPMHFSEKMKSFEEVLNKYDPDKMPEGAKVSMGVEYEVTESIADTYQETNSIGYKESILMVSESANISKGNDAIHEIALKPNYNPYMLMAEMNLLQEAGFLDLNFEKYDKAPRGYHLSLVGDSGLYVKEDMFFLNNVMTMAQLTGITAGKEVYNTKNIHSKSFDNFSDSQQKGERCEIKGMATDSVEQFEKAVITAHHAGIAIQLCNKYIPEIIQFAEVGPTPADFEKILQDTNSLSSPFESDQERDIVYAWAKLRREIVDAIGQHNKSFIDSEFNGYVINKSGEYIDTSEHIDIVRNKKLVDESTRNSEDFRDSLQIGVNDLVSSQTGTFVNALTRVNNIFLKPPQEDNNSPVNAKAVLDTVKQEGYGDILDGSAQESVFDNGGEFRDGYYYTQGASEEMIIHKSQILLNHFNKNMEKLLQTKGVPRATKQEELITA